MIFIQSAPNFMPGATKIQSDLNKIREETLKLATDLAPVRKEDLELLSASDVEHSARKRLLTNHKGVFTTIFEEPAVAYFYRKYLSSRRDAVIFAKTTRHEFFYWMKGGNVQIVVDDQPLGSYEEATGVLTGTRSKKMIAKLDKTKAESMPVIIQGKEAGRMSHFQTKGKDVLSQRVFEYVKNDLSPEEEAIILSIAIFEMVVWRVGN